jgi:archaetidylinositol phosphate synthase
MGKDKELHRRNQGWLSQPESRLLTWIAERLPRRVTPDSLTCAGLFGAILALLGYILSTVQPAALALVNLGLLLNWFGDSLDGHVARRNGWNRPSYGFFLDQSVDVVSQLLFTVGLALAGYLRPEIVIFGFASYLMMTVQSLLRAHVSGVFDLATGGFGLTEVRVLFFIANIVFFLVPPNKMIVGPFVGTYADLGGILWVAVNLGMYLAQMLTELKRLSKKDREEGASAPPTGKVGIR